MYLQFSSSCVLPSVCVFNFRFFCFFRPVRFFFCRRWVHEALNTLKHEGTHMFDAQLFACSEGHSRGDKMHTTRNAIRWATNPWLAPRAKVVDPHLRFGLQACRTRPSASEHICSAWKFVDEMQEDLDNHVTTAGDTKNADRDDTTAAHAADGNQASSAKSKGAAPRAKITDQMSAAQVKAAAQSTARGTLTNKKNEKLQVFHFFHFFFCYRHCGEECSCQASGQASGQDHGEGHACCCSDANNAASAAAVS